MDFLHTLNTMFYGTIVFGLMPITLLDLFRSILNKKQIFAMKAQLWHSILWMVMTAGVLITDLMRGEVDWFFIVMASILLVLTPIVLWRMIKELKEAKRLETNERIMLETGFDWLVQMEVTREKEMNTFDLVALLEKYYPRGYKAFVEHWVAANKSLSAEQKS